MSTQLAPLATDEDTRVLVDRGYRPGSLDDFDRLYRDSQGRLLRTLVGVLGDLPAAEDCVQETFVRALRAWPRWRPQEPAEAWLHRIALNVARSHRRRERLRGLGSAVRRLRRDSSSFVADDHAWSSELLGALRRLPPDDAAVIVLRFSHGYTNRDIAVAFGAVESTVESRLATAKARFRAELERPGTSENVQSFDRAPSAAVEAWT